MDQTINKYDAVIDMTYGNSAYTQILSGIRPKSVVLEFGPAAGAMTRYMKENLDCDVYIVEIDKGAFEAAISFAKDGVCGDAMTLAWKTKFAGVRFDYVLFVDILEHVYDPKALLAHAAELLKDDGAVMLSVPNIAHNSIIINLLQNKFEYKGLGLLDESHIRFFTYYSLLDMLDGADLVPIVLGATYITPSHTEFKNSLTDLNGSTEVLRSKDFANVYQFVFTAMKKPYYHENKDRIAVADNIDKNASFFQGQIFFDTGEGFNENDIPKFFSYTPGDVSITVNLPPNTQKLLFCPTDNNFIVISNMKVMSDGGFCDYECANGNAFRDHFLFLVKKPYFVINIPPWPATWIRIECKLSFYDPDALCGIFIDLINFMGLAEQAEKASRAAFAEAMAEAKTAADKNRAFSNELANISAEYEKLAEQNRALMEANAEYAKILDTLSWRITKPLRWVRRLVSR